MKKIILPFFILLVVAVMSCNNQGNTHGDHNNESQRQADSLKSDVDEGHNIGMARMGKLTRAEQATRRLIDSISKLPAKARQSVEPWKAKLDSLQKDLRYAETAMDKWMSEYKWDSTFSSIKGEIDYLTEEKLKVTKVKEGILNSLQKADTLLKQKF